MDDQALRSELYQRLLVGPDIESIRAVQRDPDTISDLEEMVDALQAAKSTPPSAVIGFDTNALKRYRGRGIELGKVLDQSGEGLHFVIPGQSYVEFYNNHDTFSKEQYKKIETRIRELQRDFDGPLSDLDKRGLISGVDLTAVADSVAEFSDKFSPGNTKENVNSTLEVLASILNTGADVPFVSREQFLNLGNSRLASKTPPGWADHKTKGGQALGDFYCWADFLLGLLRIAATDDNANGERIAVFVSGDMKSDWNMSSFAHPYLAAECRAVTGFTLRKLTPDQLSSAIDTWSS
ncbi:PIN-like domain-containing protein [Gordonia lacunae]|uniref:PIN-like domain-containing protein n=1 Tax=Gordonia lacunae TaxID=417102 RepID=UPI0039E6673D